MLLCTVSNIKTTKCEWCITTLLKEIPITVTYICTINCFMAIFGLTSVGWWLPKFPQGNILRYSNLIPYLTLRLTAIFENNPVSQYQNGSILDFIGGKDNESDGDNWSCKPCKAPVKSSPPTNQYTAFYRPGALPVAQSTVSEY